MLTVTHSFSLQEKLNILADAAKYDVACTSSGSDRRGKAGYLGNSFASGICHSFAGDGRCISLLKILYSNECVYDCKYCVNRRSNDRPRATFTPEEVCQLTMEFYRRNYIEGLFLSSGVCKSPEYTMERIYETLLLLRETYRFNGYIHVKAIPSAPTQLLTQAGFLADRMSINMELPTEESLHTLAPHKTFQSIFHPMKEMAQGIAASRLAIGKSASMERHRANRYLNGSIFGQKQLEARRDFDPGNAPSVFMKKGEEENSAFIPAGQSTQMIIGASPENDYQLLLTSQNLYQRFDLKRVFYSAYIPVNEDSLLPPPDTAVPLLREHRLYQADWLLRFYGFHAEELLSPERPNFNPLLDPKCEWALRHLEHFPIEVNTASFETLLRIPGIGNKSAMRIVNARRYGNLDFSHLKKTGVVLKRAQYFITCGGKMMYRIPIEEKFITRQLTGMDQKANWELAHPPVYRQMSLFEDMNLSYPQTVEGIR
ncbi:putative DNA modification/repair radical SAM protein [Ruminococcus sp. OA3]|uniref:putative DNA modification/repair radical SAM protein n=1 Tax=Ruminococcus sp. OA3 TaxID=2914164 RepID=UPI001F053F49|nr:putative DNA modification/repair radical SAM protein [Ruminococcus sp. OA3]MCH1983826.1 putative DNA modification/repair radical SAM protein [Ruminococcus sp. OA3]